MPYDLQDNAIEAHFAAAAKLAKAADAVWFLWHENLDNREYRELFNVIDNGARFLERKARELY